MKVIKRDKKEVEFDSTKIEAAIKKARNACTSSNLSDENIADIADYITYKCKKLDRKCGRYTGYGRRSAYGSWRICTCKGIC